MIASRTRISTVVGWRSFVAPRVVELWDQSLMTCLSLRMPDRSLSEPAEHRSLNELYASAVAILGPGWTIHHEERQTRLAAYNRGTWPFEVCRLLDEERARHCLSSGRQFELRTVLTLTKSKPRSALGHVVTTGSGTFSEEQLQTFEAEVKTFQRALASAGIDAERLSDDRIATYLHRTISDSDHKVRASDHETLSDMLPDAKFSRGLGVSRLGDKYLAVVSVCGYPSTSGPKMLDALGSLPFEYSFVRRFMGLSHAAAKKMMSEREEAAMGGSALLKEALLAKLDNWRGGRSVRDGQRVRVDREQVGLADEAATAQDTLKNRTWGLVTCVATVMDRDQRRCAEKRDQIVSALRDKGQLVVRPETVEPFEPWLMSLPGNRSKTRRTYAVTAHNFVDFLSTSSRYRGPMADSALAAMTGVARPLLETVSPEGSYRVTTESVGGSGHSLVFGMTGDAGKSTFMNLLGLRCVGGWPRAQVISFSVGRSELGPCLMTDGVVYAPGAPGSAALQPLARVDDERWRGHALTWLALCVEAQGGQMNEHRQAAFTDALTVLAAEPRGRRTMTSLGDYLVTRMPELAAVLEPYTLRGAHGAIFDGDDSDKFQWRPWTMIDLSELKKKRRDVVIPAVAHLLEMVRGQFDGRPTFVHMDECPDWLSMPGLEDFAIELVDTARKLGVRVTLCAQTPAQLTERLPKLTASLQSGVKSVFFGPNPGASTQSGAYAAFGVGPRVLKEIAAIKRGQWVHLKSTSVRSFDTHMGELEVSICGSSSLANLALFDSWRAQGLTGDQILQAWLERNELLKRAGELGYACVEVPADVTAETVEQAAE